MPGHETPEPAMLAGVAAALDRLAHNRLRQAEVAKRGAAALRGDAAAVEAIGGAAAQARLATLALRAVGGAARRSSFVALPPWRLGRRAGSDAASATAGFLSCPGPLDAAPIELARTVVGAEQARRLLERAPPPPPPDPARMARAADLDDLTLEEAYAAYAKGRIASPRLMAVTGLRSFGGVMAALSERGLGLPRRPSPVGLGRDDRDLLWEEMGGRADPALADPPPRPVVPSPGPELDAAWPTAVPDDPASRAALAVVAVALDAWAEACEAEAERPTAAAAGLRGDAAAVGGEAARERLVAWVTTVAEGAWGAARPHDDPWAFGAAWILLQPLRAPDPPFEHLAGGDGALELARTEEGAALMERWLAPRPGPDPARVAAATDLADLTPDEACAAYADGWIASRRLMAVLGTGSFSEVWGQLAQRCLSLPAVPTHVGPGRDDRDLLWEMWTGQDRDPAGCGPE